MGTATTTANNILKLYLNATAIANIADNAASSPNTNLYVALHTADPGAGGTQRFARAAGKAKAMDMILTGRMMDAVEAERCGIVARIVPADTLLDEAQKVAKTIAGYGKLAVMAAKESVDRAFETPLSEGVRFERRVFHGLFGTEDQKEGMAAFSEKRPAQFTGR